MNAGSPPRALPVARLLSLALVLLAAGAARAHPMPFSTVDLRIEGAGIDVTVTAHESNLAGDLAGAPAEIAARLGARLALTADGQPLRPDWSLEWAADPNTPARRLLRLRGARALVRAPARLTLEARLVPRDPAHQSIVNVYEGGALRTQAILDREHARLEHFTAGPAGRLAVIRQFVAAGIEHILIGLDHVLFLVGLLLLGGSVRRLLLVASAFTLGHSLTLTLAVLQILDPPARLIEPAIALSIVCVGADNLFTRPGARDLRPFFALAFGLIHGFGFAGVLREVGLPAGALGWSLFSFNLGVEIGQLAVVLVVASALAALRARSERVGRGLALAGSVVVAAAGTFWFIERVFFARAPGGIS